MATQKVSPLPFRAQFPTATSLDAREIARESLATAQACSLYMAIIQQPIRKWEKPWLHQRAIVLFASSPEETRLRLELERRMKPGEQVLQVIPVGE